MVAGELIVHAQQLCGNPTQPLTNPNEYFKGLLALQPATPPTIEVGVPIAGEFVSAILSEFEIASVANYLGDVFLFYKFFTGMLFKALSLHAWLRSNPNWQNPPNYINQIGNEVERKFLSGLFPEINQEIANQNKLDFIDWFDEVLERLTEKGALAGFPLTLAQIKQYLRGIYQRDFLVNFRAVTHLKGIYRSPNPARFMEENGILEQYLVGHNITLIIDLRGDHEARRSPYIEVLLKKYLFQSIIVDFNEPNSTEIVGSAYKKKAHFLKNEVKKVFKAILGNSGATLFHCASGKDRTGVIAALLQKLAGVVDPDILAEYMRSGLDTRPEKLQDVLQYVNEQGGIGQYLELCGISQAEQSSLIGKITV